MYPWKTLCCFLLLGTPSLASASAAPFFRQIARWRVVAEGQSPRWSPQGDRLLYRRGKGKGGTLLLYSLKKRSHRPLLRNSPNTFAPSFGPAGTIFTGPATDPPLPRRLPKSRKAPSAPPARRRTEGKRASTRSRRRPPRRRTKPKRAPRQTKRRRAQRRTKQRRAQRRQRPGAPRGRGRHLSRNPTRGPTTPGQGARRGPAVVRRPSASRLRSPAWLAALRGGPGVVMLGYGKKTFLFPGRRPRYSPAARRLLFTYRGLVYLWNPLLSRQTGLMLLCRGHAPVWSPQGRAIAFLQAPFRLAANGVPQGGGIWVVDMLFRAALVTRSGGQMIWGRKGQQIFYVDRFPLPPRPSRPKRSPPLSRRGSRGGPTPPAQRITRRSPPRQRARTASPPPRQRARTRTPSFALYRLSLRQRKARPQLLARQGQAPALAPRRPLLAFQSSRGVVLFHLKTKKQRLFFPGARRPLWSSHGDLLVQYPAALAIYRPRWKPLLRALR